MRALGIFLVLVTTAYADTSVQGPRTLSVTDLVRLYGAWFDRPYEYMFGSGQPRLSVDGRSYGRLEAGIGGIVRYGGIIDAAAHFLKEPAPAFGDLTPIER